MKLVYEETIQELQLPLTVMRFIDTAVVHSGSHLRQIYQIKKFCYILFKRIQKIFLTKQVNILSSVKCNTPDGSGAY
jgi:hypothetical protein